MSTLLLLAREEWRFWLRSRLAVSAALLFFGLLVATVLSTATRIAAEREERLHHQQEAEAAFVAQPDRHPHRMVHYGHYVFRTPSPLAMFDPGLDAVTGQSLFLEGHRQNSATFAGSAASADLGGLAWLSPALVYQLFAPLLIILLGHGVIVRERESATLPAMLAQGIGGLKLLAAKALALLVAILLLLVPLVVSGAMAVAAGESVAAAGLLFGVYFLYMGIWALLAMLLSTVLQRRSAVLTSLTALWLLMALLLPALAVTLSARHLPIPGQIETALAMEEDLRQLGDGHNAADPAFERLRNELLEQYGVDTVEELPINLRGVVATRAEAALTQTLNAYAERRMALELAQAEHLALYGWLTPLLAAADASRAVAATDLRSHQRFLREAETLRFDFVQGLNTLHAQELSYLDDVNRSRDAQAEQRTRVTAENWKLLQEFRFSAADVRTRAAMALPSMQALLLWFALLGLLSVWAGRSIRP